MAASLLGGAALGPVFDILLKTVLDVGIKIATFQSKFNSLKKTLLDLKPVFDDIEKLNKALDGREEETELFKKQLMEGEELVKKCSKTKCYDALKKWKYSRKLTKLEASLVKFCQVHGFIQVYRDSKNILVKVSEHGKKLDEIGSMLINLSMSNSMNGSSSNGFSGWSDVPLKVLKVKLLQGEEQVVLVSAPAACGKTTLATMVSHEDDIKVGYRNTLVPYPQSLRILQFLPMDQKKEERKSKDDGLATVVLKLDLHCEDCAKKIKRSIRHFQGVEDVKGDYNSGKLTVKGNIDPLWLLEKVAKKTNKKVDLLSAEPEHDSTCGGDKKFDEEIEKNDVKFVDHKKPKEVVKPQVNTVVVKIHLHCDRCAKKVKRIIQKIKEVQEVSLSLEKDLVMMKGTMDIKELTVYLTNKLNQQVHVVLLKKDDGCSGLYSSNCGERESAKSDDGKEVNVGGKKK